MTRAERSAATADRLLEAAAAIVRDRGAAAVSVQRVADAAGASKGLVHYHFADKDALLAACVRYLTERLVGAEDTALSNSTARSALNDLWNSVAHRNHWGWRRALLSLATDEGPATRLAFGESVRQRRAVAAKTVAQLERLLDFRSALPRATIAVAFTAFADGLVLDDGEAPQTVQRQAYDTFWLAILSLAA